MEIKWAEEKPGECPRERARSSFTFPIHFVILSRFRYQFEDSSCADAGAERRGTREADFLRAAGKMNEIRSRSGGREEGRKVRWGKREKKATEKRETLKENEAGLECRAREHCFSTYDLRRGDDGKCSISRRPFNSAFIRLGC